MMKFKYKVVKKFHKHTREYGCFFSKDKAERAAEELNAILQHRHGGTQNEFYSVEEIKD